MNTVDASPLTCEVHRWGRLYALGVPCGAGLVHSTVDEGAAGRRTGEVLIPRRLSPEHVVKAELDA